MNSLITTIFIRKAIMENFLDVHLFNTLHFYVFSRALATKSFLQTPYRRKRDHLLLISTFSQIPGSCTFSNKTRLHYAIQMETLENANQKPTFTVSANGLAKNLISGQFTN